MDLQDLEDILNEMDLELIENQFEVKVSDDQFDSNNILFIDNCEKSKIENDKERIIR